MQEVGGLRGQLLAAESTAADAVKEAGQLRQQLRAAHSRSQNPTAAPDVAELRKQTSSVFDQVMKATFEALKDEFQPSVVYKVVTVACCVLFGMNSSSIMLLSVQHSPAWYHPFGVLSGQYICVFMVHHDKLQLLLNSLTVVL